MGILIIVYLVGCLAVVNDMTNKTQRKFNYLFDYYSCLKSIVLVQRNYKMVGLSWVYFLGL